MWAGLLVLSVSCSKCVIWQPPSMRSILFRDEMVVPFLPMPEFIYSCYFRSRHGNTVAMKKHAFTFTAAVNGARKKNGEVEWVRAHVRRESNA